MKKKNGDIMANSIGCYQVLLLYGVHAYGVHTEYNIMYRRQRTIDQL